MTNIHYINNNLNKNILNNPHNKFVVIDSNVYQLHYEYLQDILNDATDYLIIKALETHKTQDTIDDIYQMLLKNKANRNDYLIAIGGGIVTDLVGYAAATFYRGMSLIYVPTTLLAQVDATIGGKVGYNKDNYKNVIGTFYEANEIIIDSTFLTTLTDRLFREGLVELLKHGFIKDQTIINDLQNITDIKALRDDNKLVLSLIKKAIAVKEKLISQDFYDTEHIRSLLNFGHTFGHAIELDNNIYHGEAIALGMLVESYQYPDVYNLIKGILEKFACLKKIEHIALDNIMFDKKISNQQIDQVVFEGIGKTSIIQEDVQACIARYKKAYTQIKEDLKYGVTQHEFYPTKLAGTINVPSSKSQLHRYIIAAALSQQKTILHNVSSLSDDVLTTLEAIKALKTDYIYDSGKCQLIIQPCLVNEVKTIHMNESGTSLRLLLPLLIHFLGDVSITTLPSLSKRPMAIYHDLFTENKIKINKINQDNTNYQGSFTNHDYALTGKVSSQFISGLLFLLPLLDHDTTITIKDEIESLPYVRLTLATLQAFKIDIKVNNNLTKFTIKKNQNYQSQGNYDMEIDYSALAFWEVANTLQNKIIIENDDNNFSLQGDYVIKKITKENITAIDIKDTPDLFPILCVYLTQTGGTISNIKRLQYKESNRLQAMLDILKQSEITYQLSENEVTIQPGSFKAGLYHTHGDHRIAMALIIASTKATDKIVLQEIKSINKSYPNFINTYLSLGGKYNEI